MINELGDNLHIYILTEVSEDWKTFATWYSIYKNLPDAKVSIICMRNQKIGFQFFQWAKRLNIPITHINKFDKNDVLNKFHILNMLIDQESLDVKTLLIDTSVMALDSLNVDLINLFNQSQTKLHINRNIWFINDLEKVVLNDILDEYTLSGSFNDAICHSEILAMEAKDTPEPSVFATYNSGCGRWVGTMQGCPFSNASSLVADEVTVNEMRIIELWRKMVSLYSTVL